MCKLIPILSLRFAGLLITGLLVIGSLTPLCAKDFGVQGSVSPVVEESPVEIIRAKLAGKEGEELTQHASRIVQKKLHAEWPVVKGWEPTINTRSFEVDPCFTVERDIKDHRGVVFHKKGDKVNPLDFIPMDRKLLFIDGRDEDQVAWALGQTTRNMKVILVAGSPLRLMKEQDCVLFYDQGGVFLKRFSIQQIPAEVIIREGRIRVSELSLEGDDV